MTFSDAKLPYSPGFLIKTKAMRHYLPRKTVAIKLYLYYNIYMQHRLRRKGSSEENKSLLTDHRPRIASMLFFYYFCLESCWQSPHSVGEVINAKEIKKSEAARMPRQKLSYKRQSLLFSLLEERHNFLKVEKG